MLCCIRVPPTTLKDRILMIITICILVVLNEEAGYKRGDAWAENGQQETE